MRLYIIQIPTVIFLVLNLETWNRKKRKRAAAYLYIWKHDSLKYIRENPVPKLELRRKERKKSNSNSTL